jgi:hypothetical protein
MDINHAEVMAHMCRMVKQANLNGALIGAGVGAATLPLIDMMRKRHNRVGKDLLAGAAAGGMLGHGVSEISAHGGLGNWASQMQNPTVNGLTRQQAEDLAANNAGGLAHDVTDNLTSPTPGGIVGGTAGTLLPLIMKGNPWQAAGAGALGYAGGNLLNNAGAKLVQHFRQ